MGSAVLWRGFGIFNQDMVAEWNTAYEQALMTGVPCARPRSMGLDHYYLPGNQHMPRSRRKPFLPLFAQALMVWRQPR